MSNMPNLGDDINAGPEKYDLMLCILALSEKIQYDACILR
jgi:hypothetical protein